MERPDITPELNRLIQTIASRPTFHGQSVSQSIMKLITIETRDDGAGVIAPYWLGVLQTGRPPRRSTTDSGLWKRIFSWMDKHNMFRSKTANGHINEAKALTWYINKHGNQQFRNKTFMDIYANAREQCVRDVIRKSDEFVFKITHDIL